MNYFQNVGPIKAFVLDKFLYNMDNTYDGISLCDIIGVTSYEKEYLGITANINGSIFSALPVHAFRSSNEKPYLAFGYNLLQYCNCDHGEIIVYDMNFKKVNAYIKQIKTWFSADYLFTIEWIKSNNLLHAMFLDNGQLALLPNHKILLNDSKQFPNYKKLKQVWS